LVRKTKSRPVSASKRCTFRNHVIRLAERVMQEVERFLQAELPENFAKRLAAKAHHLYPRREHFHKGLNRPGNRSRENH